jgi:phosphate transport system protein
MPYLNAMTKSLNKLWSELIDCSHLVEDRVQKACALLHGEDRTLAQEIILSDYEIDEMQMEIEEQCLRLIARFQPVARDLRLLMATIKINSEVERIGDMAVNMAARIKEVPPEELEQAAIDFSGLCGKAQKIFRQSLESLVKQDIDLAHQIFLMDDTVDGICDGIYAAVHTGLKDPGILGPTLLNLHLLAGYLERIADRSVNIAEEVVFMIEGEITRQELYAA